MCPSHMLQILSLSAFHGLVGLFVGLHSTGHRRCHKECPIRKPVSRPVESPPETPPAYRESSCPTESAALPRYKLCKGAECRGQASQQRGLAHKYLRQPRGRFSAGTLTANVWKTSNAWNPLGSLVAWKLWCSQTVVIPLCYTKKKQKKTYETDLNTSEMLIVSVSLENAPYMRIRLVKTSKSYVSKPSVVPELVKENSVPVG